MVEELNLAALALNDHGAQPPTWLFTFSQAVNLPPREEENGDDDHNRQKHRKDCGKISLQAGDRRSDDGERISWGHFVCIDEKIFDL